MAEVTDKLAMVVGGKGELPLAEEQRQRWGLWPGAEFIVRETPQGLLIRGLDPPLRKVYVEPTNRCNLQCRTCMRQAWREPQGMMAMETYRRLVDGLRGLRSLEKVSFWGFGEPLLHPEIVEMVGLAKGLGAKTELITNGLLLDPEIGERLVEAGLDGVVISVDGTSSGEYENIRQGGDLEVVLKNVDALQAARWQSPRGNPEVGLEFVLMKRNLKELAGLRKLAQRMGASFVVVTNVLPYTEELSDEILYGLWAGTSFSPVRSRWSPEIILPMVDTRREVLNALVELIQYDGAVGPSFLKGHGAPSYCRFVGEGSAVVSWDGEVSPCIALMHSYTCYIMGRRKSMRRYTVGNVRHEDIKDIWEREDFVHFRKLVQRFDFPPCTTCNCDLAESNEEDCFMNTFPVCGDCLWAKGVIQCP